jgi:leucyl aminopeptidase
MTDFSSLLIVDLGQPARGIQTVDATAFDDWLAAQPAATRNLTMAQRFSAKPGQMMILPGDSDDDWSVVIGVKARESLTAWCLAAAAEALPEGSYRLAGNEAGGAALGWLLGQHSFDRYCKPEVVAGPRTLLSGEVAKIENMVRVAEATALVRDMVNTPAADMGPAALEAEAKRIADANGGTLTVTRGDMLRTEFPMIHAVGRAAAAEHSPRMIEVEWGNAKHPRIAIVGKGVCFDSGGLDLKPASGMRLMKKDMGGAAHALALAQLVMRARLPVRLHLLIPAVENAVAGNAFRPGDVLTSRKGLTVEIDNTDAEGRLVLADALTKAVENGAELILDYATLTGAARVALGPDLPALFANDDALAHDLLTDPSDPAWRMPLWAGYADMLKSDIADCVNSAEGGFAGATTAALFLQKFVPDAIPWAHFDTFAWRPSTKPGRPKGGDALGLRTAWTMLKARYLAI